MIRELLCGPEPWDAERLEATVIWADDFFKHTGMPNGWDISLAVAHPIDELSLRPVIEELSRLRAPGTHASGTFLERQALLVNHLARNGPWPERTRFGVAWGVLYIGVRFHHFRPRCGEPADLEQVEEQLMIFCPPANFFVTYDTCEKLTGLLARHFEHRL